jgi:hypothetical protein
MDSLREFFWFARIAEWAPFAGLLAVLRMRRGAIAALLGGWLGAFILVKGFNVNASIESNTFWRLLMPAWPAYLLLFASVPLLVPTLARRLGARVAAPACTQVRWHWIGVAAALLVVLPAAATAASTRIAPPTPTISQEQPDGSTLLTPIDESMQLTLTRVGNAARLAWTDEPWRASVFYRVYRATRPDGDLQCATSNGVAWYCYFRGQELTTTRNHTYVDPNAPPGATYRIGVGTNWANDPNFGDIFAFSPPAHASR